MLICSGCVNDKPAASVRNYGKLEKLDLSKFSFKNGEAADLIGDTLVQIMKERNAYRVTKKHMLENIKYVTFYNKKNLSVKAKCTLLADVPIGIMPLFNDEGKVIQEINFEKDNSFTAQMLIEKLDKRYGINLVTQANMYLFRDKNYRLDLYYYPDGYSYRSFEIDGKTGAVLIDTIATLEDKPGLTTIKTQTQ